MALLGCYAPTWDRPLGKGMNDCETVMLTLLSKSKWP